MAEALEVAGLESKDLQSVVVALKSALQIESPGLKLEAANSLWCSQRLKPRSEYIAGVSKAFSMAKRTTTCSHSPQLKVR